MTGFLSATEVSSNRTEYVKDVLVTNYDSILESSGTRRGSKRVGWFGPLDVGPYTGKISGEEVDRELLKLSMQGFLEARQIMNFPFYKRFAKENPDQPIPYGNMYRVNTESWNFEQYTKRRQQLERATDSK